MKKMIYNTKLKKLLVALLIFMLLCNAAFPTVVLAATIKIEHGKSEFSYADWINLKNDDEYKEMIEKYGVEQYEELIKEKVIDKLAKDVFYTGDFYDDKSKELADQLILNNPNGINVNATLEIGTGIFGRKICDFKISAVTVTQEANEDVTGTTKKYSDFLKWTGKSSTEVDSLIIAKILEEYDIEDDTYVRRN